MGLIRDFERRLEGLIEGTFSRLFKVGVHPVEIAKRVIREAEAGKQVSTGGVIAPNLYTVRLSPSDHERISRFRDTFLPELEKLVMDHARRNHYTFLSRPSFTLEREEDLPEGRFEVAASVASPGAGARPAERPPAPALLRVRLEVTTGPLAGFVLQSRECPVRIGRAEDNDLVIDDPLVSRHHAVISREGGDFVLRDLGSTNGTYVGARRIQARVLEKGEVFRIGSSEIAFEPS
jgi:hypothetical protein